MTYPGGKAGAGVYQAIINQFPPHGLYVEPFAGAAAVFWRKAPAQRSMLIDIDPDTAARLSAHAGRRTDAAVICGDGVSVLARGMDWSRSTLVYCDPPYLISARRTRRAMYRHELSDDEHHRLLTIIKRLPCMVAISGYASTLYDQALAGWRRIEFEAMTRGGTKATEVLWMNYPAPQRLADYTHLGDNYRERERIKRLAARWVRRFEERPALERQAIVEALAGRGIVSSVDASSSTQTCSIAMADGAGPRAPSPTPAVVDAPES